MFSTLSLCQHFYSLLEFYSYSNNKLYFICYCYTVWAVGFSVASGLTVRPRWPTRVMTDCDHPWSDTDMPLYDVDITSDINDVIWKTDEMFRREVPFTVARAMNNTLFDVRKRIVGATYPKAFDVRNQRFAGALWTVDKVSTGGSGNQLSSFRAGEIDGMTGMVRQKLDRDYIETHITGGTKMPRGSSIAIPGRGKSAELRTKTGRIAKRSRPLAITNQKDVFLKKDKSGKKRYIARRTDTSLDILFVFAEQAKIKRRFRFYEDAFDTVDRVMIPHWHQEMRRVIRRSPFTNS